MKTDFRTVAVTPPSAWVFNSFSLTAGLFIKIFWTWYRAVSVWLSVLQQAVVIDRNPAVHTCTAEMQHTSWSLADLSCHMLALTQIWIHVDKWFWEICSVFHRCSLDSRRGTFGGRALFQRSSITCHVQTRFHTASFVFSTRHWLPSRRLKLKAVRCAPFWAEYDL